MNSTTSRLKNDLSSWFSGLAVSGRKFSPDDGIVVAFSGGSDSLGLLSLLAALQYRLVAVYVDHSLRPRAQLAAETTQNQHNCEKLGVELEICPLGEGAVASLAAEGKCGIEDAARRLRYEQLERVREERGFRWIATAHNSDDQVETVLMRLFGGKAFCSLGGIRRVAGNIIRPVLEASHGELVSVCTEAGLQWSEDSTNNENEYLRNKVRHHIVPSIESVFPSYQKALTRFSKQVGALGREDFFFDRPEMGLSVEAFRNLGEAGKRSLLYAFWDASLERRFVSLGNEFADRIISALDRCLTDGRGCNLNSGGVWVCVIGGKVFVQNQEPEWEFWELELNMDLPGETMELPDGHVLRRGLDIGLEELGERRMLSDGPEVFLFPQFLEGSVVARQARAGDEIELSSGHKSVAELMQEMGIPKPVRQNVPLICDGKEVVAVLGRAFGGKDRICRKCRCTLAPNRLYLYIVE